VRVTWAGDVCYPAMVDPAWTTTGSMATARGYGHTVSVLPSGRVLVAGGDGGTTLASAEIYDAAGNAGAGTFAATGSMTTARDNHMATVLASGKVLLTGGYFGGQSLASAEIYDAGAGTFTATGSMGAKREGHTAVVLSSGKVLVAGGIGSTILASAEVFDAAGNAGAGAFAATGDLATARQGHTAIVLPSGKVLVAGGHDGAGYTASAEVFDAAGNAGAGIFTATAPMGAARWSHTAILLPSGKVLVAGGWNGVVSLASAEVFDAPGNAGAGTFTATGGLTSARYSHTASLLPLGKVLVAGGYNAASLASAELFDASANGGAGAFAATSSMAGVRYGHKAAVLPSGKVLIAGGRDFVNAPLTSAELAGGALAEACVTGGSCVSGFCADGFCCNSACGGGACDRCDLPGKEGTCTIAPSGNPGAKGACAFPLACDGVNPACPTSCVADAACAVNYYCAANGMCEARKAQGQPCTSPGSCTSNFCIDGVCCNAACSGQCEACDVTGAIGLCSAVSGPPHTMRPACTGDAPSCIGTCDGANRAGCACGASSSSGGAADGAPPSEASGDSDPSGSSGSCTATPAGPSGALPFALSGLLLALTVRRVRRKRFDG